jgi:uncharacterized C2H2 Zn-finger protein
LKQENNGHHSITSDSDTKKRISDNIYTQNRKDFKLNCDHCELKFSTHSWLEKHVKKKHGHSLVACDQSVEKFSDNKSHIKCPICGLDFKKKNLPYHIESKHKENIPCPHCGLQFVTQVTLNKHIDRLHSEREAEKCQKCEYKTKVQQEMKKHWKAMHTERTQQTCEFCGEVFKKLKEHLKRTGCGNKEPLQRERVPCPRCQKTFTHKPDLAIHIKQIHEGVKDKLCPHCSYSTYSSYNLRLHVSKVHLGTGLVKESCRYCQKESTNMSNHLKMYHSEQESQN